MCSEWYERFWERVCKRVVRRITEVFTEQWNRFAMLLLKRCCASFECILEACFGQKVWRVRLIMVPRTRGLMQRVS